MSDATKYAMIDVEAHRLYRGSAEYLLAFAKVTPEQQAADPALAGERLHMAVELAKAGHEQEALTKSREQER